jgi:hypothetical protein
VVFLLSNAKHNLFLIVLSESLALKHTNTVVFSRLARI